MKNLSLLIAAIFIAAVFSANATIYTVSNAVGITAQYSTIDAAVAAASNGDTLYVNGSATVYSMSTLTKQLTIIGIGYNPAAPDLTPTQISGVTVQADNVSFIGIKFTSSLTYSGTRNNVKIERCYFNNTQLLLGSNGNTANVIVTNCIFTLVVNNNSTSYIFYGNNNINNCIISNNIFYGAAIGSSGYNPTVRCLGGFNQGNIIISNNVFYAYNGPYGSSALLDNIYYAQITNNVFFSSGLNCTNCNFRNNLEYQSTTLPPSGNQGSNNLNGYNPIFVTSTFPTSFDFTVDLHFRSTSPGINAGTDGTDIGIYGNAYSLAFPDYTGEPQLPAFRSFDLKNPVVGASGQLRFNIHAIKKD